ncbi:MAG TPA: proton-conducting transporter membrane subunit [Rhodocyclaceae bacterium]|nr:proton-conducting transporter membrane subunit [Rhodocyclaceae bacterium]
MSGLDQLLLASAGTLLVAFLLGAWRPASWLFTALYAAQLALLLRMPEAASATPAFVVFGQTIGWTLDAYGRFFAVITVGAALAASWFASGEWGARYEAAENSLRALHSAMAANVLAMLMLLASRDLVTLFIGWELVSWASFLMMALGGQRAMRAALRYVPYAMGGAMAVLGAMVFAHAWTGTLDLGLLAQRLAHLEPARLWVLAALLIGGFGVKMGLLPFHLWQAGAYAEAPGPGTAFLGAISSRMGLFAIALVLVRLITLEGLPALTIVPGLFGLREALAWIAALTIVLPTFTALKQNDARYLLAWHGIGQGGYMLLGIVVGDAWGSAGGLMHVFNHATYQAALFLSVYAVVHRTGTADLNQLGGLIVRMPLSFLTMLVGIIGLAGLPPMNGFVSKWLVYRSLMTNGMPLLFLASVIGTLGTILSVYKLLHNTFLGQLRSEHVSIREAPWSMTLPMLALCVIVFATGTAPGLVLGWVAQAQAALGLPVINYTLGGVESSRGGLDMLWVVGVLFGGFGIGALLFYGAGRSKRLHQLDNYAGGHFLSADVRYQYSDNFYAGLMHRIGPLYRGAFAWAESALSSAVSLAATAMQGVYRQQVPALFLLATAVLALFWVVTR